MLDLAVQPCVTALTALFPDTLHYCQEVPCCISASEQGRPHSGVITFIF